MSHEPADPLSALLDTLIPPSADGRLPGAGELGLAAPLREALGGMAEGLAQGLAAADAGARARGATDFAALPPEVRAEVLREVEAAEPGFLPGLVFQTYAHYYREPRVLEALGLEPGPPHPRGHPLEPGDLGALERVRARGPLYRDA